MYNVEDNTNEMKGVEAANWIYDSCSEHFLHPLFGFSPQYQLQQAQGGKPDWGAVCNIHLHNKTLAGDFQEQNSSSIDHMSIYY